MMYTRTETDALGNTVIITQTPYLLASGSYALIDEGGEVPEGAMVVEVIPPVSLTYQQELAELNRLYQLDVESYKQGYALASLADGPQEEAKLAAIRDLYAARRALHTANVNSLKEKYAGSIPT